MTASSRSLPPGHSPVKNYPVKYPRARKKAADIAASMVDLTRKGPRSLVGRVVDTSFHVSQGYVTATTELGIVNVFSVPYGAVVPGMRIFARQIGGMKTNRAFIFDGMAPNVSALGSASGSFLMSKPQSGNTYAVLITPSGGVPITSLSTAVGYFWYLFYYLPSLPPALGASYTILSMVGASGDVVTLELLGSGLLRFRSLDGHGYVTTKPVPPHNITWVVLQPGLTGSELLVNGQSYYTGLMSTTDLPTFGASTSYTLSYLSGTDGSALCPVGSWVSKMGYGASYTSGRGVVPLPTGTTIPTADSLLPSLNVTSTQHTIALYLGISFTLTVTLVGADIGSPAPAGSDSLVSGVYTVTGGGLAGISGTSDAFHYVSEALFGDMTVSARIASFSGASSGAAGLMIRAGSGATAAFYGACYNNSTNMVVFSRAAKGGSVTQVSLGAASVPTYIRLVRLGNAFSTYTSSDGITWSGPFGLVQMSMPEPVSAGFAVTSFNNSSTSTATFDHLSVSNAQNSGTTPNAAPSGVGSIASSLSVASSTSPVVVTGPY